MSQHDGLAIDSAQASPGPPIWEREAPVSDAPSILLFTANPLLDGLESALQAHNLIAMRVSSLSKARQLLASRRGRSIAVLDTYRPAPYSFDAVYNLLHDPPAVPTLIFVNEGQEHASPPPWEATRATDDYAVLPASVGELVMRVQSLLLRSGLPLPMDSLSPVAQPRLRRQGQMVALFGLKGGIGRSTIATNLAVGLVQLFGKSAVLVDTDLWYSAQKHLLDLQSEKSILSIVEQGNHLDQEVLRRILIPHASGVQVVLGPQDLAQVERVPVDLPATIAAAYREMFDFVIVDTHPSMEEYVLQVLEAADRILLVTTPEVGPLRSTANVLKVATALGWREKMLLVLNRANAGVDADRIEQTLNMPVYATIVSAGPQVTEAANRGQPIIMLDRHGKEQVTRDLVRLVARLADAPEPSWTTEPSGWGRALGRLPWTRLRLARV